MEGAPSDPELAWKVAPPTEPGAVETLVTDAGAAAVAAAVTAAAAAAAPPGPLLTDLGMLACTPSFAAAGTGAGPSVPKAASEVRPPAGHGLACARLARPWRRSTREAIAAAPPHTFVSVL